MTSSLASGHWEWKQSVLVEGTSWTFHRFSGQNQEMRICSFSSCILIWRPFESRPWGKKGSSSIGWLRLLQQQKCWRHKCWIHPVWSQLDVGNWLERRWMPGGQRRFAGLWRWTHWKRWNHPLPQTRESHVLLASSSLYCKGVGSFKPSSHCSVAGMINCIQQLPFQLFEPFVPSVRVGRHRSSSVRKPRSQSFEKVGSIDSSGWWSWHRVLMCIGRYAHFFQSLNSNQFA